MTQMVQAMKDAGVKLPPVTQRIWQWLHDKGGAYTLKEVEIALKISGGHAGSGMYELYARGMVAKRQAFRRTASTRFEWSAVGNTFELLPIKPEFKRKTKAQPAKELTTTSQPVVSAVLAPAPAINVEDGMTLAEARALYLRLHKIFGGAQ